MRKRDHEREEDDGRTIANMNVEGMPWHRPEAPMESDKPTEKIQLTPEEARAATWGALKAALLIALIFGGVFFLVILFMDQVWLGG